MFPHANPDANLVIDSVYRSDWGRTVATLIQLVSDFDVAEEAVLAVRVDLCIEAVRLGRLVKTLMAPQPPAEVTGLIAACDERDPPAAAPRRACMAGAEALRRRKHAFWTAYPRYHE